MSVGLALHALGKVAVMRGALAIPVQDVAGVSIGSFAGAGAKVAELTGSAGRVRGAEGEYGRREGGEERCDENDCYRSHERRLRRHLSTRGRCRRLLLFPRGRRKRGRNSRGREDCTAAAARLPYQPRTIPDHPSPCFEEPLFEGYRQSGLLNLD